MDPLAFQDCNLQYNFTSPGEARAMNKDSVYLTGNDDWHNLFQYVFYNGTDHVEFETSVHVWCRSCLHHA